jgi:ACS family tartrate transporter-like MFS transporter
MMFVRTPMHFYGARVLLGCAEAGYFPGAAYFLSKWFPRTVRAQTMSQFYVALPISTVVMGGLAGMLLRLNGRLGLTGWQWMFLIEAAPAVVLAFVVWFGLADTPSNAKWLDAGEREALLAELASDPHNTSAQHGSGLGIAVRSGRVWLLGLLYFLGLGAFYALAFSLPLLLTQLTGWDTGRAGYLVAASGVVGAVGMLANAWHSDKACERRWHIAALFFLMAAMPLMAGLHLSGWVPAVGLLIMMVSWYTLLGPLTSVLVTVIPGEAAAIAIAFINMFGICGGFVGPYWMGWMREATGGYAWGIGLLSIPCLLAGLGIQYLLRPVKVEAMGVSEDSAVG